MKLRIEFKQHNEDYSQEYADVYQGGEESESNWKYKWSTGYQLDNLTSFDFKEDQSETFVANTPNGKQEIVIDNIVVLECVHADGRFLRFGVSKSILKRYHQTKGEKHKKTYAYFYIKGDSEFELIGDAFCIDINELPNPQNV